MVRIPSLMREPPSRWRAVHRDVPEFRGPYSNVPVAREVTPEIAVFHSGAGAVVLPWVAMGRWLVAAVVVCAWALGIADGVSDTPALGEFESIPGAARLTARVGDPVQ